MANVPIVMVSSTFRDLKAEREGVRDAIQGQGMLPRMMETELAIPDRGLLTNSRAMELPGKVAPVDREFG